MGPSLCLLAFLLLQCAVLLRTASATQSPSSSIGGGSGGGGGGGANFFVSVSLDLSEAENDDDDNDDDAYRDVMPPLDDKSESLSRRSSPSRPGQSSDDAPSRPLFSSIGSAASSTLQSLLNGRLASAAAGGDDDGGCHISAQVLMCQGGGGDLQQAHSDGEDHEEHEDEDDDDDDNNDDGHSSMLSNASLRRSRGHLVSSSAGGGDGSFGEERTASTDVRARGRSPLPSASSSLASFTKPSTTTTAALFSLRGGGGGGGKTTGVAAVLQSQAARNLLVTALVTLVFEGSIGHILEFLKIVKQTAAVDVSYLQVLRDITRSKGVAGLWDGFCPWGIVQAVFKGAVFGLAYQLALNSMRPLVDAGLLPAAAALTLAGGVGGGLQGYVLSPTLLLKTRVMTNPVFRERMSVLRTTWLSIQIGYDICATEGFITLMRGSNVFALKRVFDWSSRYLFSDLFESLFAASKGGGAPLTVAEKSVASLLGGVFSTCVTLPLDVLVAKTQDAKKAGVKVSAIQLFLDELREKGLSGLQKSYMQGFEARLLHVCLTTVVIKTLTPIAYKLLFPER